MLIEDIQKEKDSIQSIVSVLTTIAKAKGMMNSLASMAEGNVLFHDTFRGYAMTRFMGMLPITKRKKPTNTPISIHNEFDNKIQDIYGFPFRSEALFVYPALLKDIPPDDDRLIILVSDKAQLLYSNASVSSNDFYIRFSAKNRELLRSLSMELRQAGVNKFRAGEIEAVMDVNGDVIRDIKALNLSNVYAFAVQKYPNEAPIILKYYIQKLDRFLNNDAKKMKLTNTSSIFSEISKKPEIMIHDNEVLYIRTDELFYHIDGEMDEFLNELSSKIKE